MSQYVLLFFYLHSNTKWKVFEKYMNKYLKYFSMYSYLTGMRQGREKNKGTIYMGQISVWYEWAVWGFGGRHKPPEKHFQFCSLSEGKPSGVYQKHKNCHFLNMHFNVSDPKEGFFHTNFHMPPQKFLPGFTFLTGAFSDYKMLENLQKTEKSHPWFKYIYI